MDQWSCHRWQVPPHASTERRFCSTRLVSRRSPVGPSLGVCSATEKRYLSGRTNYFLVRNGGDEQFAKLGRKNQIG